MQTPKSPVELGYLTQPLEPGTRIETSHPVLAPMLTHHIPGRAGVLTTPNLVGLFEDTAADLVRPRLAGGAASVGTRVDIHHTGAAFEGDPVRVSAAVTGVDGRRIGFEVAAHVGDRPVGHGNLVFTLVRFSED
jgi:predicted thioesterase